MQAEQCWTAQVKDHGDPRRVSTRSSDDHLALSLWLGREGKKLNSGGGLRATLDGRALGSLCERGENVLQNSSSASMFLL